MIGATLLSNPVGSQCRPGMAQLANIAGRMGHIQVLNIATLATVPDSPSPQRYRAVSYCGILPEDPRSMYDYSPIGPFLQSKGPFRLQNFVENTGAFSLADPDLVPDGPVPYDTFSFAKSSTVTWLPSRNCKVHTSARSKNSSDELQATDWLLQQSQKTADTFIEKVWGGISDLPVGTFQILMSGPDPTLVLASKGQPLYFYVLVHDLHYYLIWSDEDISSALRKGWDFCDHHFALPILPETRSVGEEGVTCAAFNIRMLRVKWLSLMRENQHPLVRTAAAISRLETWLGYHSSTANCAS